MNNISIFLNSCYDIGKYSRSNSWSRKIFYKSNSSTRRVISSVSTIVYYRSDSITLSITISNSRIKIIGPICIIVCGSRNKELLRTNPIRTIPPLCSFLNFKVYRTESRTSIRSGSCYRNTSTERCTTCSCYCNNRIYCISNEGNLRSRKTITSSINRSKS